MATTVATAGTVTSSKADPTKYCCSVIPVRYVLLVVASFAMCIAILFGAVGILAFQRLNSRLTELHRLALFFHIAIYLCFSLLCVLGLYGALARRAKVSSIFTSIIIGQLLFSMASGALCLYYVFQKTPSQDVDRCLTIAYDEFTKNLCRKTPLVKCLFTTTYGIMWVLEIVTIFVGNRFLSELREEALDMETWDPKYGHDGDDC